MFLLKLCRRLWNKYPVAESLQTGLLMGTGDAIAQTVIEENNLNEFDVKRTGKFFIIGITVVGPPLKFWYRFLQKYIGSKSKLTAVKKVAVDQILFAPVFMGIILGVINFSQGYSLKEIKKRLEHDYFDVMKNNYKIWPMVQLCNFYLVPLQFQVLVVQVIAVFWNSYISWKTNKSNRPTVNLGDI